MNIKVNFDNIKVKETKKDFTVKILMLKGEKGEQGDLNPSHIVDNLTSNDSSKVLSAKQGKVLKDLVDKKPYYYNTVADMKAGNLSVGDYVITKGYYSANDGGNAEYIIKSTSSGYYEDLTNELVAELIINDVINIKQFGAKCDGVSDDYTFIQKAIDSASEENVKLIGVKEYSIITKTLKIPVPINIDNLYLKAPNDISEFTNGYMIYLNTTDGATWDKSYNDFTDNKIENIKLYNPNTSNILNGFKSIANVQLHNVYSYGLNKTFDSNTNKYVDCIQIKNILVSNKTGNDYCIDIGLLGDMVNISDGHIYESIGDNYFIRLNGAHRPSTISNIINGIINLNYGNISLNNYHGEGENKSYLLLNNGNYSLNTLVITDNKPCIRLNNAFANIINFNSQYNYDKSYLTDVDIKLENNSNIEIKNCYKDVTIPGNATQRLLSPIVTNVNNLNKLNNKYISNFNNIMKNDEIYKLSDSYLDTSINEIQSGEWKLSSGTYYYALMQCYDNERGIVKNYRGDRNITLNDNAHAIQIELSGSARNKPIRLVRGTQSGSFTHYVDLFIIDNVIRDNGNIVNGNVWKEFDNPISTLLPSIIGGFNEIRFVGDNIIGKRNAIPTSGTFKVGDIILNNNITNDSDNGWICINAGTPGTWKAF